MKLLRLLLLMIIASSCVGLFGMDEEPAGPSLDKIDKPESFGALPYELLRQIAQKLPIGKLRPLAQANKLMSEICRNVMKAQLLWLWRHGNIEPMIPNIPKVSCLAISADSRFIVTGHQNGSVSILDSQTGQVTRTLETVPAEIGSPVNRLAISPDSRFIATGHQDGSVCICHPQTGQVTRTKTGSPVSCLAISPDSRFIATGHQDGSVCICHPQTGQVTRTKTGSPVSCLAISPNGIFIATGHKDGLVRILDPQTGKVTKTLQSTISSQLLQSLQSSLPPMQAIQAQLLLASLASMASDVYLLAISADSRFIVMARFLGDISTCNPQTGQVICQIGIEDSGCCQAISADSRFIVTGHQNGCSSPISILVLNTTGHCIKEIPVKDFSGQFAYLFNRPIVAISSDSKFIAICHADGSVSILDLDEIGQVTMIQCPTEIERPADLAISADSKFIAMRYKDGSVCIWRPKI